MTRSSKVLHPSSITEKVQQCVHPFLADRFLCLGQFDRIQSQATIQREKFGDCSGYGFNVGRHGSHIAPGNGAGQSIWNTLGADVTQRSPHQRDQGIISQLVRQACRPVELDGKPFRAYAASRVKWAEQTAYLYPGAIQYYGPDEICDSPPVTLTLEQNS